MALLRGAIDRGDIHALARTVGCGGAPAALDEDGRHALGLGAWAREARVAAGPGALRVLLLHVRDEPPLREQLLSLARRLTARTPHTLWLVVARQAERRELAIAAWTVGDRGPRLSMLVARGEALADSDADTVRALAAASGRDDILVHARWAELLGREGLSRRFYRALEQRVRALADSASHGTAPERRECALLCASRLLFVAFLEARGWLDGDRDFLVRQTERVLAERASLDRRLLRPLFFGTLNTPLRRRAATALAFGRVPFLNGGLFAPTPIERRLRQPAFANDAVAAFVSELLARYNFTAREHSADLTEAAVDPEMLGHAFESLMASEARRASGAFFTPHALVCRTTDAGLRAVLAETLGTEAADAAVAGGPIAPATAARLRSVLAGLTVLDPACGSGAFLVHALDRLTELTRVAGDAREPAAIRRELLTRSIFGVDRNPTAVWLCELRLWLAVVMDESDGDPMRVPPLPNLDRNVRAGDALAGGSWRGGSAPRDGAAVSLARMRYARASGARKLAGARRLERLERAAAVSEVEWRLRSVESARRELVGALRGRDLFGERVHRGQPDRHELAALRRQTRQLRGERARLLDGAALPFAFSTHFADVAARGGFSLVVGNPPWVRPHRVPARERARLRESFVVARSACWTPVRSSDGGPPSLAGNATTTHRAGFGPQVDLAALFVERSVELLAPGGTLALLLPAKLWRSLAGGGVRRYLLEHTRLALVEDHGDGDGAFDAVVYPSLVVAVRRGSEAPRDSDVVRVRRLHRGAPVASWRSSPSLLRVDATPESGWLLAPREVREAFDRVRDAGTPFADVLGAPSLGVKCGCNEAFVVARLPAGRPAHAANDRGRAGSDGGRDSLALATGGYEAAVRAADGRAGTLPDAMLRPVLRGENLRAWSVAGSEWILWTHDERGAPLASLPPLAERWLARWRRTLERRSDARNARRWWELFRIDGARSDRPRVVWPDVGRSPRAVVLDAHDPRIALNSCYVSRCPTLDDALALAAVLNSPLAAAWLGVLAEPARGGYARYLAWTTSLLPLPRDWTRARLILAPLAERGMAGDPPSTDVLLEAALEAYSLRRGAVAPLLAWAGGRWTTTGS